MSTKISERVDMILVKNDRFVQARHLGVAAGSPANESCIAMIEHGLDDMDFCTKHLKDGQDFYSVMSPKLEQVKQQIGDISVRLAVERFEHEESADRQQRTSHPKPALALPGVVPLGYDEPHVEVDDIKVARLVEMGLDLGKAVAALKNYDNNVDLAPMSYCRVDISFFIKNRCNMQPLSNLESRCSVRKIEV